MASDLKPSEYLRMTMPQVIRKLNRENFKKLGRVVYKHVYQALAIRSGDTKSLLFIFGHQRSGTTLMTQLFDRDPSVKVYGEYSPLSVPENGKAGLRLRPLPEIATHIGRGGARIVVIKPLVESQNAQGILSYFSYSKALWMYRGYDDVVASKIKKSGKKRGIEDLEWVIERNEHWEAENVPGHLVELARRFYSPEMNPYDAAAVFWYIRNQLFFDQALDRCGHVQLCKYEDLVSQPETTMNAIYRFLTGAGSTVRYSGHVHSGAVGKGGRVDLSPTVRELCDQMLNRMNTCYEAGLAASCRETPGLTVVSAG